jgi:hypothetical protein
VVEEEESVDQRTEQVDPTVELGADQEEVANETVDMVVVDTVAEKAKAFDMVLALERLVKTPDHQMDAA